MSSEWALTKDEWDGLVELLKRDTREIHDTVSKATSDVSVLKIQMQRMQKPVTDPYKYTAMNLCIFNFVIAAVLYGLSKTGYEDFVLHPGTAIVSIAVNVGITGLMARWRATSKVSLEQYIHLGRAAVLLTGTMYANEWVGADAGFVTMATLFFVFYTWSLMGDWAGREADARVRAEAVNSSADDVESGSFNLEEQ